MTYSPPPTRRTTRTVTHYEILGVEPSCGLDEIRSAYRRLAREHHPDIVGHDPPATANASMAMAEINEAWRILSDVERRRLYDQSVVDRLFRRHDTDPDAAGERDERVDVPQPAPQAQTSRRRAWAAGVQGQIAKLSRLAGRSATQTLLIRQPRGPRPAYERLVTGIVEGLCEDTESRVRAARAAGAAPLDLAVGATLIGIRTLADRLRRDASIGVTTDLVMTAELLDRMWDVLAHELTVQLATALGGNPHVARDLLRTAAQRGTGRPSSAPER